MRLEDGTVLILVTLLAKCVLSAHGRPTNRVDACTGKSIAVMDLNVFASQSGFPTCKINKAIKIDPRNGIPYLPGSPRFGADDGLPFNLAAHGGPWHLHEAIRTSKYFTSNVDTADIVYVYDHCLYIQWLAQVHTEGRKGWDDVSQAGEWLIAAYNAMLATPRWQRNNGSDFVFYDPHPGFTDGRAEREYLRIMCEDARLSVHIVVETGQRNICKEWWTLKRKLLVAPYVPGSEDAFQPLSGFKHQVVDLKNRDILLYWQGTCLPVEDPAKETVISGKTMRHVVSLELDDMGPDVEVMCTDKSLGGTHTSFQEVVDTMRHARFCLVLPGDSASARRTSEIFMAGCIPVFLGPPFGSMPLAQYVDYKSSSVVVNATQYRKWLNTDMLWENPKDKRPFHVQNPWYWTPDADVKDYAVQLEKVTDLVTYLRSISPTEMLLKFEHLAAERRKFAFQPFVTPRTSAINVILEHVCKSDVYGETRVSSAFPNTGHSAASLQAFADAANKAFAAAQAASEAAAAASSAAAAAIAALNTGVNSA